jgi:anaerobic magnesium-protoporphyrin IX monomethyl ester cyclase
MKILLINPAVLGMYKAAKIFTPPMGLTYIASYLRENGHNVQFIDCTVNDNSIDYSYADLVGITSCTYNYNTALEYAQQAHECGKTVVMGGVHVSCMPNEALMSGYVDYVVRGEGEETMLELVNVLESGGEKMFIEKIKGLSWYDKQDNVIKHNPDRPAISNLDKLPYPARDLLDIDYYKKMKLDKNKSTITVLTSRGCPYKCNYCVIPKINSRIWREREVNCVTDEVETLLNDYGFKAILFVDDNLTINKNRTIELCKEFIRRKLDFKWWCQSRADTIANNEDMVETMAEAGCITVFLGLESGSDKVLKNYNKKSTSDTGINAVDMLNKYGIGPFGAFIIGSYDETPEDIDKTINYSLELNLESAQYSILTPYPGTDIYKFLKDKLLTRNWDLFDGVHALFNTKHLSTQELNKILYKAYRKYYFRLKYFFNFSNKISTSSLLSLLHYAKNLKNKSWKNLYNLYKDKPIYEPLEDLNTQETKIEKPLTDISDEKGP